MIDIIHDRFVLGQFNLLLLSPKLAGHRSTHVTAHHSKASNDTQVLNSREKITPRKQITRFREAKIS